jgi:F-type H+-transporting ATPase subunit b
MDASTITEIIGFVIVVAVLWWKVVPPIRKAMKTQQDAIAAQIQASAEAEQRLAAAQRKYEDAVAEAHVEAAKIRDGARADAQRIVEDMRVQAEQEVVRIRQRAEDDLANQRQQVIRELRARIGGMSAELAARLVTEHLSAKTRQSATVDHLLDELESMSAREGVS